MTQTIKDRLELLKRDQNAKKEDDPHFTGCGGCGEQFPAICGCRDFNAGVDACLPLLEEVRKETWEEAIKLSEEIERVEPDGGTRQWIAFKRFRNTLRDYLSALDKTPPNKV